MYAVNPLSQHALRAPERVDALRPSPAPASRPTAASAAPATSTGTAAKSAPTKPSSSKSTAARAASAGSSLSWNSVAAISECTLRVWAAVRGLRETAHLALGLAHGYCSNHLHGIGGSGLAKRASSLGRILVR
jgi:hypothetical protein